MADFNHSPQTQVAQNPNKYPTSSDRKKGSMNSQNKSIFTHKGKGYKKQMIDKKQAKQMNLTQTPFLHS